MFIDHFCFNLSRVTVIKQKETVTFQYCQLFDMCNLKSFFSHDLETGGFSVGWFGTVCGFLTTCKAYMQLIDILPIGQPELYTKSVNSAVSSILGVMLMGILQIITNMILVYGTKKKIPGLLLFWLIFHGAILIILAVLVAVTGFYPSLKVPKQFFWYMLPLFYIFGYFWLCIKSLRRKQLRDRKRGRVYTSYHTELGSVMTKPADPIIYKGATAPFYEPCELESSDIDIYSAASKVQESGDRT